MTVLKSFANTIRRGLIVVLDGQRTGLGLRFPINPAKINDSHSANYVDHPIIGRGHPRSQYTGSGPRVISFRLMLDSRNESFRFSRAGVIHRGNNLGDSGRFISSVGGSLAIETPEGLEGGSRTALIAALNFLRALTKPRLFERERTVEGEILTGPPPIMFVWGRFMRLRCIVREVAIEFQQHDPELTPTRAQVSITLNEQPNRPVTFEDYLRRGDTRESLDTIGMT